jgi:hypothetical protein
VSNHSRFASDEIERLLAANGIYDLDSAFQMGDSLDDLHQRRATRHSFKRVVKVELKGAGVTTTAYIKRQWRREPLLPRPTDIWHRIRLQCSPMHEWHGLRTLQALGFHVSEPLGLFWRGWGLWRGAIITRAVPSERSMLDMLLSGELQRMDSARRQSLMQAATEVVVRLNAAKVAWRSMKPKHFYPEDLGRGNWRIWLIDCEGVFRWASRRECDRQWRMYLKSFTSREPALQDELLAAYRLAAGKTAA